MTVIHITIMSYKLQKNIVKEIICIKEYKTFYPDREGGRERITHRGLERHAGMQ